MQAKVKRTCETKNIMLEHMYHKPLLKEEELLATLHEYRDMVAPYVGDVSLFLDKAIKEGKKILLEGQLGTLKDPDHGIYPMVTSSSTLAAYGAIGAGIPPYEIKKIVTVSKAYSSAVGAGAFVSEIFGEAVPDISLTTDIIVGFPGETEEDFQDTLDIVRQVRYDSAFTFIYSKRTGTPAAAMEDQVPDDVVKDRFDRLLKEVQQISAEVCSVHQGTTQDVLVESVNDHDPSLVTGRMSNNLLVHFPGDESMIGKIVTVYLKEAKGFYYMGELCK